MHDLKWNKLATWVYLFFSQGKNITNVYYIYLPQQANYQIYTVRNDLNVLTLINLLFTITKAYCNYVGSKQRFSDIN